MNTLKYKYSTVQKPNQSKTYARFCLSVTATLCTVTPENLITAGEEPLGFSIFSDDHWLGQSDTIPSQKFVVSC